MKRILHIILFAAAVLTTSGVAAQMKTAYFMEGSIQRLDMNAAFVPQRGYVNIPGLGNLGVDLNSNYLSVRNFFYPNPDGSGLVTFMHESVGTDEFLKRMHNRNHLNAAIRENIFGFGGFARRYFWSFNVNVRSETALTIPKQFFELAKDMHTGEYEMDGFHANSDNYLEFAIGFAFPIRIATQDLNIGFRVKALAGAAHAALDVESMRVSINDEEWRADLRGQLTGNVSGMNFSHLKGKVPFKDITDAINFDNFDASRIGSWGLAFDIGADTRLLDDRLKVSLGINDLGFIRWSQKSAVNGTIDNLSVSFRGYNFDDGEPDIDKPDDVEVLLSTPRSTSRMLTATMNIGGEYTFLDNRIGLGLLSQTRFYGNYASSELTVSANFRPLYWLDASLSQSLLHNRMGAFGFALNLHPSWINFFLGMDYIAFNYAKFDDFNWIPKNLKSINVYFGLAIPITKPKQGGSFPVNLGRR